MSPYEVAWLLVVLSVLGGLFCMHRLTRRLGWPATRRTVALLLATWLLLPAPLPDHPGHYAPAFLVFAFESLFQLDGEPRTAGIILIAGTVVAVALLILLAVLRARRVRAADSGLDADPGADPSSS